MGAKPQALAAPAQPSAAPPPKGRWATRSTTAAPRNAPCAQPLLGDERLFGLPALPSNSSCACAFASQHRLPPAPKSIQPRLRLHDPLPLAPHTRSRPGNMLENTRLPRLEAQETAGARQYVSPDIPTPTSQAPRGTIQKNTRLPRFCAGDCGNPIDSFPASHPHLRCSRPPYLAARPHCSRPFLLALPGFPASKEGAPFWWALDSHA